MLMTAATLLNAVEVSKTYSSVRALDRVSFTLEPGEIHALVGENGAGKSTLIKVLTGVHSPDPDGGRLEVNGEQTVLRNPLHAEKLGIYAIHQHLPLVDGLSILENFLLGKSRAAQRTTRWGMLDRRGARPIVAEALALMGLDFDVTTPISALSVPEAQLVQIARALATDAKVLILDEPTASLTAADRDALFDRLRDMRERGVGLVYVSHRLDEITTLCDRATVLRNGAVVERLGKANLDVGSMIAAMLDRPVQAMYPPTAEPSGEAPMLTLSDAVVGTAPPLSLKVRAGEVLGLTGLVGAGMVEAAETLAGVRPLARGRLTVEGRRIRVSSPAQAMREGISLVPEDRSHALVAGMSIERNLALTIAACPAVRDSIRGAGTVLRRQRVRRAALKAIGDFNIQPGDPAAPVGGLSGGNQQKVVIAKAVATRPKVLILIEPTAGVDVGARAEIYAILRELGRTGVAVILVSSDGQEICGMSDRVLVFRRGTVVAELPRGTDEKEIMLHATTSSVHPAV
ncbi:sugar ABC transporter ATP-binding protein [Acrocarpospora macrocephala]|uniref:Putative ribose/galactose/methyl galactoside import ATP-binding protein 3 n=2 Tax=Acrocarpospora macrocephala TaxID=150177 RepID=A0A5M3WRM9_9ACTN|nr:putative ribose/galactose/methyl galactoside import ATP-binding protein 3 [Acrocarpospora macrocephala]